MPGIICIFADGIVMLPPGVPVGRLTDATLAAVPPVPDICIPDPDPAVAVLVAGAAGASELALITISGPPATRAMLSSTTTAPAVAPGAASRCSRGRRGPFLLTSR